MTSEPYFFKPHFNRYRVYRQGKNFNQGEYIAEFVFRDDAIAFAKDKNETYQRLKNLQEKSND